MVSVSPVPIISDVCIIQPDHLKINWMEGLFQMGLLVQDYVWPDGLVVLCYVAENWRELVAECRGYDVHGNQII